jgi:hypothetical protein
MRAWARLQVCGGVLLGLAALGCSDEAAVKDARGPRMATASGGEGLGLTGAARFNLPASKTAFFDPTSAMALAPDVLARRNTRLAQTGAGLKLYDLFWRDLEEGAKAPSNAPIACDAGYRLVPSNATLKAKYGYNHYHCYKESFFQKWDGPLSQDAAAGFQVAAVLWNAPPAFRNAGCSAVDDSSAGADGCIPRDDAMPDFQDYVTFLASNYAVALRHFIVWNEIDHAAWFNMTPLLPTPLHSTPSGAAQILAKYATMFRTAYAAIKRQRADAMVYVSLTAIWKPGVTPLSIGAEDAIFRMWQPGVLGLDVDWSLAIHPYGVASTSALPSYLHMKDLPGVYLMQTRMLQAAGATDDPLSHAQAYIIASEQSPAYDDNYPDILDERARFVCEAHEQIYDKPWLVAATHIYLQNQDLSTPRLDYAFLPGIAGGDLSGADAYSTWRSYLSTHASQWHRNNTHFCCARFAVGCLGRPIYRKVLAQPLDHLLAIDPNEASPSYRMEGIAFNLALESNADTRAIYRCNTLPQWSHYASIDPQCEVGRPSEALLGYLYTQPRAFTQPVYRCVREVGGGRTHFLITTSLDECQQSGHALNAMLGYAPY